MSERGSFVTQYIYCENCLVIAREILIGKDKYFCSIELPGWNGNYEKLPIIAGKIGGLYSGEELDSFADELIPLLKKRICHSLRISVLAEQGSSIFVVNPEVKDTTEAA